MGTLGVFGIILGARDGIQGALRANSGTNLGLSAPHRVSITQNGEGPVVLRMPRWDCVYRRPRAIILVQSGAESSSEAFYSRVWLAKRSTAGGISAGDREC